MTYSTNMQHTHPDCPRCGRPAEVDWCDVRQLGDVEPRLIPGHTRCATPDCVDEHGRSTVAPPPSPEQLHRRAEDIWLRRQQELAGVRPEAVDTSWITTEPADGEPGALVRWIACAAALLLPFLPLFGWAATK